MSTGTAPCTPLGFTQAAAAQTSWTQTRARSLSSFSAGIAGKSMPRVLLMPPLSKHASEVPTRSRGQLVTPGRQRSFDSDGGNRHEDKGIDNTLWKKQPGKPERAPTDG